MLRLSGFPLNPYFNQQIFPPVPNVAALAATGVTPAGTNATTSHLRAHIGPNVTDISKYSETSEVNSPVIAPNRTESPKIAKFSSPSSTASASSVPSPVLAPSFLPKSISPKKELPIPHHEENKPVMPEVSPRKRNRKVSENSQILDPLEPLEKISRLEHLASSIGGSTMRSTQLDQTANSSSLAIKSMKTEVFSVTSSSSSPVLKNQSSEVQSILSTVQAKPLVDQSVASESAGTIKMKKLAEIPMIPKEVQIKDNLSSSEDFSSSEDNEDKNENIKVFKNGVEMTTWHCDVCKCIFLDQVSKITLFIKYSDGAISRFVYVVYSLLHVGKILEDS